MTKSSGIFASWGNVCEQDYFPTFHSENHQTAFGLLITDGDLETILWTSLWAKWDKTCFTGKVCFECHRVFPLWAPILIPAFHFPQNDVWIFAKIKSSLHSSIHGNMGCFHVVAIMHDRKSCHLWQPGQTWRTLRKMKKGYTESRILRDPTYRWYVKWSISQKQRREWLPGAGWGERETGSYYAQCIKFQL